MEVTDPLTRFTGIVLGLSAARHVGKPGVPTNPTLGIALCYHTGRIPAENAEYTIFEGMEDFASFLKLGTETEKYILENSPPRAKDRNMSDFYSVISRFQSLSVNSSAASFDTNNFNSEYIRRLEVVSENLSAYGSEKVIGEEDIKTVIVQIDSLIEFIVASSIDDRLRDALVKTLGVLRMELTRVNIIGTAHVVDNVDRMLGQAVRAAMTPGTDEQHKEGVAVFEQAVGVADGVGKLVDTGQKLLPVLVAGGKVLGILP